MNPLFIFLFSVYLIENIICSCNWEEWSSSIKCEWVDNHCLKGYHRNCICDYNISIGSACNSNLMTNFIQTKPFVSNFYSNQGICYKTHCSLYSNWCQWESWSHWNPITNITCNRHRKRKCCLTQPQIGYTSKKSVNYGCFVSTSKQNSSQIEEEVKHMKCSPHSWWLNKVFYGSIGLVVVFIILIICLCTGSKSSDNRKISKKRVEFPTNMEVIHYEPTAPPLTAPTCIERAIFPLMTNSNYPNIPPTYDETIRASFADTENENRRNEFNEKKNFPDFDENNTIHNELSPNINTNNISPPSYTVYSRNPSLFHPST